MLALAAAVCNLYIRQKQHIREIMTTVIEYAAIIKKNALVEKDTTPYICIGYNSLLVLYIFISFRMCRFQAEPDDNDDKKTNKNYYTVVYFLVVTCSAHITYNT